MNNYQFFRNPELRFILRGWAGVSQRSIEDIETYCLRKRINTSKWTESAEMWNAREPRLKLENTSGALSLTKLRSAKSSDEISLMFLLIGLVIPLLASIYYYFFTTANKLGPVLTLISCSILVFLIYKVFERLGEIKKENIPQKELIIRDTTISLRVDNEGLLGSSLQSINFYWQDGESSPKVTLDLLLNGGKTIRLDNNGDYRELFLIGDTIQERTGVAMHIMQSNSPFFYTHAL